MTLEQYASTIKSLIDRAQKAEAIQEELEDRAEEAELRVHALEQALITGIANGLVVDTEGLVIAFEVNDDSIDYFLEEMGRLS